MPSKYYYNLDKEKYQKQSSEYYHKLEHTKEHNIILL